MRGRVLRTAILLRSSTSRPRSDRFLPGRLAIEGIDGAERLRIRSFRFSVTRQFEIQNQTRHRLEIVIKSFPWWRGVVSLDGQCIIDDLFPSERKLGMLVWGFATLLCALVAAGVLLWLAWTDRR